jgi:hypothetical protein
MFQLMMYSETGEWWAALVREVLAREGARRGG